MGWNVLVIMHNIYLAIVEKHYSFNDQFNLIRKTDAQNPHFKLSC